MEEAVAGVGPGIASAIAEMLVTGRWAQLARLRGDADPEAVFCSVPGVGPETARAIHEALHVDTLEALETAAHDGRLEDVAGFGPRRTVLYSNTARAHELGRTRDWVVMYYYDGDHVEAQCTVVTETRGALAGKRVVRGREQECRAHYEHTTEGEHA